jgi:hypothetical protein
VLREVQRAELHTKVLAGGGSDGALRDLEGALTSSGLRGQWKLGGGLTPMARCGQLVR